MACLFLILFCELNYTLSTGLGLYIVRKIMEMHHAKYGITNTSNGVMFWFELPCKQPIDNSI